MPNVFKVGDRVRITGKVDNHFETTNCTGVVTLADRGQYIVAFDKSTSSYSTLYVSVKIMVPEEVDEVCSVTGMKLTNYNDVVKIDDVVYAKSYLETLV